LLLKDEIHRNGPELKKTNKQQWKQVENKQAVINAIMREGKFKKEERKLSRQ